eukprot:scaffold93172_cov45-Phaeocystis_antarctica.AAC.1
MVIRTGDGGWNFCRASKGVVVEPCKSTLGRQGYVDDVKNKPAATKIYVWDSKQGDSSISYPSLGCNKPPPPSLPPTLSPPPPPTLPPPCTYTLMNDALPWADADAACQAAGLQLATVQSAAQNALLLATAADNMVWIGGTDATSEG